MAPRRCPALPRMRRDDGRGRPERIAMSGDLVAPVPGPVRAIDLGTHALAYADLGSGDPVILMHGGLTDHQS